MPTWSLGPGKTYTSQSAFEKAMKETVAKQTAARSTTSNTVSKSTVPPVSGVKTTTGSGSTKSTSSSSGSSSSTKINTSGLSGYALAYANAINAGKTDAQAHAAAQAATSGAGSASGVSSSSALNAAIKSTGSGASKTAASTTTTSTWQQQLESYKTNTAAGYAEIARAGEVYNQKMASGDVAGAQAAHTWANQIRDAMGISAQYNAQTGAPISSGLSTTALGTAIAQQPTATLPTGETIPITIDSSGRTITSLPVGSIVDVGGNSYKITGGTPGNYTSVEYSRMGQKMPWDFSPGQMESAYKAINEINTMMGTNIPTNIDMVDLYQESNLTPDDLWKTSLWLKNGAQGNIPVDTSKLPALSQLISSNINPEMQVQAQPLLDMQAQLQSQYQTYLQMIADAGEQNAALIASLQADMLTQLDSLQANLEARMKEMMGGIDPATQAAITALREELSQERNKLMDEMSRRGLLQSGIWTEAEARLSKGLLTAEEKLVADRVTALQDQMIATLTNYANAKLNITQQYDLQKIQAAEQAAITRQNAQAKLMDITLQLGQMQQQQTQFESSQNQAWNQFMKQYNLQLGQAQQEATGKVSPYIAEPGYTIGADDRSYMTADQLRQLGINVQGTGQYALRDVLSNIQWHGQGQPITGYYNGQYYSINPSVVGQPTQAAQQNALSNALATAGVTGYYQGKPTIQYQSMLQKNAAGAGGASSGGTATKSEYLGTAMNDIWREANRRLSSGEAVNSVLAAIEAQIWQNAGAYQQYGVNPSDLVNYLYNAVTGQPKSKSTSSTSNTPWG